MTLNELISTIKANLGDRSSGTVGGYNIDTVVINAVNTAMTFMLGKYNPLYYNRTATLALTTATRTYNLPTTDTNSAVIRIKDILNFRCYDAAGTDKRLTHLNYLEFVDCTPNFSQNETGTPNYFAIWQNKLILDYIPEEALTLAMYVVSHPVNLTAANANFALPIEDDWLLALEAYATSHVYHKLQQLTMAQSWQVRYQEQLGTLPSLVNKLQSHNVNAMGYPHSITDPVNNPFVNDWN